MSHLSGYLGVALKMVPVLPLAVGLALGADDSLEDRLLSVLDPAFPGAAFSSVPRGKRVFRAHSRVFRDPDRLGPDRGGISLEYRLVHQRWTGAAMLPSSATLDAGVFQEHFQRLASGDHEGYLEAWIRVPTLDPPGDLAMALDQTLRTFAAEWKPGPDQRTQEEVNLDYLLESLNYPGGRHLSSPGPEPSPSSHFSLDEIADQGQVYLHPDGQRCLLRWFDAGEGIGYGDVVLYRKEARGWRIERVASHILLPEVVSQGDVVHVTYEKDRDRHARGTAFSLPWHRPTWREDGSLRDNLQRLLLARDGLAYLQAGEGGEVIGHVLPQVIPDEDQARQDEPVPARVIPGPEGLIVEYRLLRSRWRGPAPLPQRSEYDHGDVHRLSITLASGDDKGYLEVELVTPTDRPDNALREAVIREMQTFAAAWKPGLGDPRFAQPTPMTGVCPPTLRRLVDRMPGAIAYLHPDGRGCLFHVKDEQKVALYRRSGQTWRLQKEYPDVRELTLEKGRLLLHGGQGALRSLPWARDGSK